jgi:predicted ABC-class ATPase
VFVAVPVNDGATVLAGANNAATPVAVEMDHRVDEPVAFVAVTAATMNLLASADTNVYVRSVAPAISVHTAGLTTPTTV